jgi:GH15 family glucan-1,4-alpha-glucosidase
MKDVGKKLWVGGVRGGLARYEGDGYHRKMEDSPGNPWLISTLWLAKWHIVRAKKHEDMDEALRLISWVARSCLETGIMPEQVHPLTGEPLSVAPLTWSHAEFVDTITKYQDKRRRLNKR